MRVSVNITGPSAENRALFTSNQKTLNFYPERQGREFVLHGTPGYKAFSTGNAPCRGWIEHKGTVYQVQGSTLYSVNSAGSLTSLGSIAGSEKCVLEAIGDDVIVVVEGNVYRWNGSTLTTGSDPDFESPTSCAMINNQMLYNGTDNRWCVSDVGSPLTIDSLNYATAESDAGDIVRVFTYDQKAYFFKERSTEPWFNSGQGNPPFDRIEDIIPIGLIGIHAVGSNDTGIYFLGDDKNAYILQETTTQRISTPAIANLIDSFSTAVDCEVNTVTFQSHNWVLFTFPNADRTLVFDETVGVENGWFEMSSGNAEEAAFLGKTIGKAFNKTLVSDSSNGNLYEMDASTYDEVGTSILRIRDTAPIRGDDFRAPGLEVEFSKFQLFIETGVGSGSDPNVVLQFSDDGGRTFSTEAWGQLGIGTAGEYIKTVEWNDLGSSNERVFRIKGSDAVLYSIRGAAVEAEPTI